MKLFLATQTGCGFTDFLPSEKFKSISTNCFLNIFLIYLIIFQELAAQEFGPIYRPVKNKTLRDIKIAGWGIAFEQSFLREFDHRRNNNAK